MQTPLIDQVRPAFLESLRGNMKKGAQTYELRDIAGQTARRLGEHDGKYTEEFTAAILEVYSELFRAGALNFGSYLDGRVWSSEFRLTATGRALLEELDVAPENKTRFLAGLPSFPDFSPVAKSYLNEALDVFVAGHHRAAAVLLGAAVEVTVLELRDAFVGELGKRGESPPSSLSADARPRGMYEGLATHLPGYRMSDELRESFEAHWQSFLSEIRLSRNAAGHPTSIASVTRDDVRAGFLQLRYVLRLAAALRAWIDSGLQAQGPRAK
jgi:hypothetical protein